jgi:hypothetical protein
MNNMNPLYQEKMVHLQAENLEAEIAQVRLEKESAQAHVAHNGWVAHRIAHFAEWMIATGESLRQRYDHAAMHNYNSQTGMFVH